MKNFVLACAMGAALIAGPACSQNAGATTDPSLIVRANCSGLDGCSALRGDDKVAGLWEDATSDSAANQRPGAIASVPASRQWSHLNSRERRRGRSSSY